MKMQKPDGIRDREVLCVRKADYYDFKKYVHAIHQFKLTFSNSRLCFLI